MDSFENPGETPPVDDSMGAQDSQEQEVLDLIFPADQVISVSVYAYVSRTSGKPVIKAVMERRAPELTEAGFEECEIRSSWTTPKASQMDEYRQECSGYQLEAQTIMVNNLAIRDLIVANHLKELLLPPKYKPFPFKYTRPDRLTGDTVKQIKSMHSGIYDTLYTKFISESCLVV